MSKVIIDPKVGFLWVDGMLFIGATEPLYMATGISAAAYWLDSDVLDRADQGAPDGPGNITPEVSVYVLSDGHTWEVEMIVNHRQGQSLLLLGKMEVH